MKIAIPATGEDLDAQVDPRFGRCHFFVIVDSESMEFKAFPNESATVMGGAGTQAAQFVYESGAEIVLTGDIGPNAYQILSAAGMKVFAGVKGKIKDAIDPNHIMNPKTKFRF